MNTSTLFDKVIQRQRTIFALNAMALVAFAGGLLASVSSIF